MSVDIKGFRIFLSWQEGLEDERQAFFDAVDSFNKEHAIPFNLIFIPIDWKTLPGGFGPPQSKINLTLGDCDFLVVTFWCRWGSPPDEDSSVEYTSRTEEEYETAKEYLVDKSRPMQEILVCFKEIPPTQLTDPGEQVAKVQEFKRKAQKEGLLKEFKGAEQFKELITNHLEAWMRNLLLPKRALPLTVKVSDKVSVSEGLTVKSAKQVEGKS